MEKANFKATVYYRVYFYNNRRALPQYRAGNSGAVFKSFTLAYICGFVFILVYLDSPPRYAGCGAPFAFIHSRAYAFLDNRKNGEILLCNQPECYTLSLVFLLFAHAVYSVFISAYGSFARQA